MRLLVSVRNADEARAAVDGGADIIDAKDPSAGALGAVSAEAFREIRAEVDSRRLVTAALGDVGDACDVAATSRLALELVSGGAGLVKVGFSGVSNVRHVEEAIAGVMCACSSVECDAGVIAVAYADGGEGSVGAMRIIPIAASVGAKGVLVDTADKHGPGLMALWSAAALEAWVAEAHAHGLLAAVAGKLLAHDLRAVRDTGADVAGVRGAACEGGRMGRVVAERVRWLRSFASADQRGQDNCPDPFGTGVPMGSEQLS